MIARFWFAGPVLAGLLMSACPMSSAQAKPPDLPVDLGVICEETPPQGTVNIGLDLFSGRVTVRVQVARQPAATPIIPCVPCIDPTCPVIVHEWWQRLFGEKDATVRNAVEPVDAVERVDNDVRMDRLVQARRLYQIGERCRQRGDLAKARTCFEEVHLLCPDSPVGRAAIRRLADIEAQRETRDTEESEIPMERTPRQESNRARPDDDSSVAAGARRSLPATPTPESRPND